MARPQSETKKARLFKDLPFNELWGRLDKAMKETGMLQYIMKDPVWGSKMLMYETAVSEKNPGLFDRNRDQFMYKSRVPVVREMLKSDNNWLVKWTSKDQKRFWNVNIVKENFLRTGELPAHYKNAVKYGGVFRWSPTANINVIMLLRGTGKSHTDVVVRSIFDFINNPSYKSLIGHSEESKAKELIKRIADALFNPNLMVAFPEFFADEVEIYRARGTEIKSDSVNMRTLDFNDLFRVMDPTDYMRGEKTFNLFTPNIDPTGQHVNLIKIDDWVTKNTSASETRMNEMKETFNSFSGLEEYTYDDNGKRIPLKIQVTDTAWWGPSFIKYIIDNKDCNVFVCPMSWDDRDDVNPFDHKYRMDDRVDNDFIRAKQDEFKEWFPSQCYMIERPRETTISLATDRNQIVFRYSDETGLPETIFAAPFSFEYAHMAKPVIISKDPSYSEKNKNIGDDKSKDATLRIVYSKGIYYITGAMREFGNKTLEGQKKSFVLLGLDARPDYCIIDSQGTQVFVSEAVFKSLNENEFSSFTTEYIDYTKKKDSAVPSKTGRIQSVLSTLFEMGSVKVHWKLVDVVNQILRSDPGFDFLDALQMARSSIEEETLDALEIFKTDRFRADTEEQNNLQSERKSGIIFRTTGY